MTPLEIKQKITLQKKMQELKERFAREGTRDRRLVDSPIKSRYDDIYFAGVRWLSGL